jgi:hypothetical protein
MPDEVKQAGAELPEGASVTSPLPEVTSANQWRKVTRATYRLSLPSGVCIRARRVDLGKLIRDKVIQQEDLNKLEASDAADRYALILPIAKQVAPHAAVEPRIVVPNGSGAPLDEESINVEDVPMMDLIMIYLWSAGYSSQLPTFEEEL